MCVVEVDFVNLIMPADKGLALVKLLQSCAARADYRYTDGHKKVWTLRPLADLSLTVLQPEQIDVPIAPVAGRSAKRRGPLLIGRDR
ncbi:MAG: hypothetical protein RL375_2624 [Pseudomonadota bacterium]